MKIYEIIAETVILQQNIFNCSTEEVWEVHIHPRIREVHSLEKVLPYIDKLNNQSQSIDHATNNQPIQGIFVEHQGYVITLVNSKNGKLLQVYREGVCVYRHPHYILLPENISIILRRYMNLRKVPFVGLWNKIESEKFETIINQNLQEV